MFLFKPFSENVFLFFFLIYSFFGRKVFPSIFFFILSHFAIIGLNYGQVISREEKSNFMCKDR